MHEKTREIYTDETPEQIISVVSQLFNTHTHTASVSHSVTYTHTVSLYALLLCVTKCQYIDRTIDSTYSYIDRYTDIH